jgi:proteasome lid subunit RPN8/RPN11
MKAIIITHEKTRDIVGHLRQALPNEGCGLLLGHINNDVAEVHQCVAIPNVAKDKAHHFMMDGEALGSALLQAEQDGLVWVGIYHSHVGTTPRPSPSDIEAARWQTAGMAYLIVAYQDTGVNFGAWCIDADSRVERLEILANRDAWTTQAHEHRALSAQTQRMLVLGGFVAMLALVWIAVSLLPAAPDLTQLP